MIRSMTGYGRDQQTIGGLDITVEIRSVNHRYFEYASRLPRVYGFLDEKLKSFLQTGISRGKVDVSVSVNHPLAEAYLAAFRELCERYDLKDDVTVTALARQADVLSVHTVPADEDAVWEAVRQVAQAALEKFLRMRETEGEKLRADVLSRADAILRAVDFVDERSPQTVKEHMDKVTARMRELLEGAGVDEQRLLTEAALYADKIAVAEETVRLRSHIDQLRGMMEQQEPVGRKLDFLVQEINREANTIGSKSQDVALARTVVDMKSEIEKIREQIQNIE